MMESVVITVVVVIANLLLFVWPIIKIVRLVVAALFYRPRVDCRALAFGLLPLAGNGEKS